MGKKHVVKKTEEELLREREKVEELVRKGSQVATPSLKLTRAKAHINSSFNNTIIALVDFKGNVLTWASAGSIGFKGTKKGTPFAATKVGEVMAEKAKQIGVKEVMVFVKGVGAGRESAIRALGSHGLEIISIKDITPLPHNGCRPPKVRRV